MHREKLNPNRFHRSGLRIERLEERALMTAVPAYSSSPGAAKTLYLDFDGDFQPYWNRTDNGQMYYNVASGEYNKDNVAGFNSSELADIKEIWQEVADDYSPFNINVTTVEPAAAAFTTNQAMRIVIAGNQSAQLFNPHFEGLFNFQLYSNLTGDRFISNDGVSLLDTSGYSSINSFTDSQPNVAFVFAAYTNKWGSTDAEGHARNYAQLIANTASHEAGHTFGLVHHQGLNASGGASAYDVGNYLTTPLMGDNTASDRTIWSKNSTQDTVQILTNTLGARADDVADYWYGAKNIVQYSTSVFTTLGSATGIIGTLADADFYHITSVGGTYNFNVTPTARGNLDAKVSVYRPVFNAAIGTYLLSLVGSADPSISSTQPFSGVGASLSLGLGSGDYYVKVSSHGSYGDLGMYTLTVGHSDIAINPSLPLLVETTPVIPGPNPLFQATTLNMMTLSGGEGSERVSSPAISHINDLAFAQYSAPAVSPTLTGVKKTVTPTFDAVQSLAVSRVSRFSDRVLADLAFAVA